MWVSLVSFLFVIAICILIHELGHFISARYVGIQVHEFAFGMGPALFKKKKGETLWSIRAFPIGGFVRLAGMGEERFGENVDPQRAFNRKTPWQRLLVLAAGPFSNIILAIILTAIFLMGHGVLDLKEPVIGSVMTGYPAAKIGLVSGDRVVAINGHKVAGWEEMSVLLRTQAKKGPVNLDILREGRTFSFKVVIPIDPIYKVPLLGIRPPLVRFGPGKALVEALGYSWQMGVDIVRGVIAWISGTQKVEVAGPVGIASLAGEAARQGAWMFVSFLAVINLNLGLLNLFPFPALDGGHLFFVLGEILTGRKLPEKWENLIHYAGFIFLLLLILVVTWKDILKLIKPHP